MSRGYCDDVPFLANVDSAVRYFHAQGKPTVATVGRALSGVGRNNGPELLWTLWQERLLTLWALRRHVGAVWSGCEFPEGAFDDWGIGEEWSELFWAAGYTVDGRRAPKPEAALTLYRGASVERRDGWSWTDDVAVAEWFAKRSTLIFPDSPGRVWRATVEPWRLYARNEHARDGEPEYVVDVDGMDITEVTGTDPPAK